MNQERMLEPFSLFRFADGGGIGAFFSDKTDRDVLQRLAEPSPLSLQELNQLLVLAHEGTVSEGFYRYYWLELPPHPYSVTEVEGYDPVWFHPSPQTIQSLEHLRWGIYRLYVDGLLYFGNVRSAFRHLRSLKYEELTKFFHARRNDTEALKKRGPHLTLKRIEASKRYLVSEIATKAYGAEPEHSSELRKSLLEAYHLHIESGGGPRTLREILDEGRVKSKLGDRQAQTLFSANEVLDELVRSAQDIEQKHARLVATYQSVRAAALRNTELYLSMVNEMDVYVATSMRSPEDFQQVAAFCDEVFSDPRLTPLMLRHFDPTRCAANGHEDKGLIECLMVKCAKTLVYCAGEKDSYGKDAEAAVALSLGKPVIFYCDQTQKEEFYRDTHPLSRLIEFNSGVAVGAMVTDSIGEVKELLARIFENKMQYRLEQRPQGSGYLRLVEGVTNSVVRVQTSSSLLTETFWNHYRNG